MTVHPKMFDKKKTHAVDAEINAETETLPAMNRIFVGWDDGYFITTLDPDFNKTLQEMIVELGAPTTVEFRATDEGWFTEPTPMGEE